MRCGLIFAAAALFTAYASPAASIPLTIQEPDGIGGAVESVTFGVPFPQGQLKDTRNLRLTEGGKEVPLQTTATATWNDRSLKWVLLDFRTQMGRHQTKVLQLHISEGKPAVDPAGVKVGETADGVHVSTGPLRFMAAKTNAGILQNLAVDLDGDGSFTKQEQWPVVLKATLTLTNGTVFTASPPETIQVETAGPERASIRVAGWLVAADATARPRMQYIWRLHAYSGSAALRAEFTLVNLSPTQEVSMVRGYAADLELSPLEGEVAADAVFGGEALTHNARLSGTATARLVQAAEGEYRFEGEAAVEQGIRSAGWLTWNRGGAGIALSVRDCWQQFPIALRAGHSSVGIEFYPADAKEPFDWDRGLAKTHEFVIGFGCRPDQKGAAAQCKRLSRPLIVTIPPKWHCSSKVFGDLAPFDFDLFPDYETLVEASGDKLVQSMATGIRNWGDFYYGGPYKGKNSYVNLEYDMPHNCIVQFARTGQRKYLDLARAMARHLADIDVNHFTGWQWKHSPRHTETQAEFGHTFTRGLLEHYFITGDRRSFEVAIEVGNFFAKDFQNPRSLGNERQIGWGLISLLPVYEATWDKKYLEAVNATLDRLIAGLEAKGKFSIRWDNRIAFFNGIAATGLIYVHRATGDERVADAAMRVIRRTKGFHPEYAGRTLEALAWAYQRSKDPECLDLLKLTYETTQARALAWRDLSLGAGTIFTAHALPWLEPSGLITRPADPLHLSAEQFASENGLHARHIPAAEGEIYLNKSGGEPATLVVVRKGAWKSPGEAVLLAPDGKELARIAFPAEPVVCQRKALVLPAAVSGTVLLRLYSPPAAGVRGSSIVTWDVVSSQPMPAVINTPRLEGLQYVTPALFSVPAPGATNIVLTLVGEGEGFKKAVLYDPENRPVATLARFIDLDDKGRYEYTLSAPVPESQRDGLWSIVLQDAALTGVTGLSPYFSSTRAAFFRPHVEAKENK